MSDVNETTVGRRRRTWAFHGVALTAALAVAAPAWAQSAEELNSAELKRAAIAAPMQPAMPSAPQSMVPAAPSPPIYPAQAYAYPADIDCNDPYYASYCLAYATWLNQYYGAYAYPYDYWYYGYPVDVAFGIGFFRGHRFHNFHHFAFAHGIGFHGGFHGGGFRGGGFHGGGGHR
jgi:hypothetical protein